LKLKTDRAQCAFLSSFRRRCGFLATAGVIGLAGVLAAPTGAAAAMFTMEDDYGYYGPMTGGYREKHSRKSRGEERRSARHQAKSRGDGNAERRHGRAYGADDGDYGSPHHGKASHPNKHAYDPDPGDGKIKHHNAGHGAPDDGDKARATSKQSEAADRSADRRKLLKQNREAERREAQRRETERREAERREAAQRKAERHEAARQEAERRVAERHETERREATRQEVERREAERHKAEREAARREAARKEAERREGERREAARQEATRHETERREAERKEAERREVERREAALKEAALKEAALKEAALKEAALKEAARQDAVRQEAARQETARQEAERREAERREAARLEAERREAERRETARQEADRREAAHHEAERREAARQEAERREASRRKPDRDDRQAPQAAQQEKSRANGTAPSAPAKQKPAAYITHGPFGDMPTGPLQIIISINQQKVHIYSDGTHVTEAPIATGVPGHPTPMGVFSVIDKERYHESNIYSSAPMPYMQRITWSGVALHQGQNLGHPASHGCIRMSQEFASRLWVLPSLGARVIIARPELLPRDFADPHLFVHMNKPPAPVPMAGGPGAAESVKTAETVDSNKTTDAATPSLAPVPFDERLRGAIDAPSAAERTAASNDVALKVKPPEPGAGLANGNNAAAPDVVVRREGAGGRRAEASPTSPTDVPLRVVPLPTAKPSEVVRGATGAPIAVFVSRKTGKIYVRRQFVPLFDSPVVISHPERPFGTHVFTAMEYLADGSTFRWNVVSLPGEGSGRDQQPANSGKGRLRDERAAKPVLDPPTPETPQGALARIEIPQGVIERISELMVAGSSLVVSDHDLGDETGQGTDFIVVTR
jgi:lipoprotein-anchoring transpeptidase ErfK/SrfK